MLHDLGAEHDIIAAGRVRDVREEAALGDIGRQLRERLDMRVSTPSSVAQTDWSWRWRDVWGSVIGQSAQPTCSTRLPCRASAAPRHGTVAISLLIGTRWTK